MKWTLIIGALIGAAWSIVPIVCSELFHSVGDTVTAVVSGCMTGAIVSWLLRLILTPRSGVTRKILLGALSLPLGAFLFGVIISFVQLGFQNLTGTSLRFVEYRFAPIESGMGYAMYSTLWVFGPVLIPLAVGTTFLLMWILKRIGQQEAGPYGSPAGSPSGQP